MTKKKILQPSLESLPSAQREDPAPASGPTLRARIFDRRHISEDLAHLNALTEHLYELAMGTQVNPYTGDGIDKVFQPIKEKVSKVRQHLNVYQRMIDEEHLKLRTKDLDTLGYLQDACDRIEFIVFSRKREAQKIPSFQCLETEKEKQILNGPDEISEPDTEGPIYVFEPEDLERLGRELPIIKAYEKNRVFTVVLRSIWRNFSKKKKTLHVKKLVVKVGQRMRKIRVVDEKGNLMAECQHREIEIY